MSGKAEQMSNAFAGGENVPESYTPLALKQVSSQSRASRMSRRSRVSKAVSGDQATVIINGVSENSLEGFSDYVHALSPSFWLSMVMGGFIAPGGGPIMTKIWQFVFLLAMLVCGSTCLMSCFTKDPPFHAMFSDAMVALIHIPGFYSIFFWSKTLGDPTSAVWLLLSQAHETQADLSALISTVGPFLIPAQIGTVCLVWAGYAVPTQQYVNGNDTHWLTDLHAYSMWVAIPPVVACVVANVVFFAFFVYAMYLQVNSVLIKMFMREEVEMAESGAMPRAMTAQVTAQKTVSLATVKTEEFKEGRISEEEYYEAFMASLADEIFGLQDMIDLVCEAWSSLVALFLTFAFFNILAVFFDFIVLYLGRADFEMTVWIYCIDTFLVVSGLGILMGFLLMGAVLTQRMDDLCVESVEVMRSAHVPISMAASTFYYLQTGGRTTLLGFKVYGYRIQWSHAIGFVSLLLTAVGFVMTGPNGN